MMGPLSTAPPSTTSPSTTPSTPPPPPFPPPPTPTTPPQGPAAEGGPGGDQPDQAPALRGVAPPRPGRRPLRPPPAPHDHVDCGARGGRAAGVWVCVGARVCACVWAYTRVCLCVRGVWVCARVHWRCCVPCVAARIPHPLPLIAPSLSSPALTCSMRHACVTTS